MSENRNEDEKRVWFESLPERYSEFIGTHRRCPCGVRANESDIWIDAHYGHRNRTYNLCSECGTDHDGRITGMENANHPTSINLCEMERVLKENEPPKEILEWVNSAGASYCARCERYIEPHLLHVCPAPKVKYNPDNPIHQAIANAPGMMPGLSYLMGDKEVDKEKQVALKLRFIVTKQMILVEVVFTSDLLGEGTDEYDEILPISEPMHNLLGEPYAWVETHLEHPKTTFIQYQKELTEFADNGCFHQRQDPPVPRIEKESSVYALHTEESDASIYRGQELGGIYHIRALEQLIGKEIPIYEPKDVPTFSSEWRQIHPVQITTHDLQGEEDPYIDTSLKEDETIVKNVNKKLAESDLEVWTFTITKEGE